MKRVGAECTGVIFVEVVLHINHVGAFTLQGDHVKALPHQVVSWYEGCGLALAGVPHQTGENKGLREEDAQALKQEGWKGGHACNCTGREKTVLGNK